jgi:hypothetical protein
MAVKAKEGREIFSQDKKTKMPKLTFAICPGCVIIKTLG